MPADALVTGRRGSRLPALLLRLPAVGDNAAMQIEPSKAEPPKRKRRWFQFSLRSLLLLVLLARVGMTWLVAIKTRAERQKAAIDAILKDGGFVTYDYEVDPSFNLNLGANPPGPSWLRKLLDDDHFFTTVAIVNVQTDIGMKQLGVLNRIRMLGGPRPVSFPLPITDEGLRFLEGLSELQELDLTGLPFNDADLRHVKGLSQLRSLKLGHGSTQITDAGLINLKGLNQLKTLSLDGSQVTDAGLEHLKGLSQLESLNLYNSKVTDAGLDQLRDFKNLTYLGLRTTHVTGEGIAKLQHALPNCTIYH
jgi:Leucine-rich repeat (LRR) protein